MSLKVVKFDTKMYLNFSNFQDEPRLGGGQALVQKRGQVSDGGIGKIFAGWGGTPQSPQEKNPALTATPTCSGHSGTVLYETYVAGQRNLNVYENMKFSSLEACHF